MTAIGRREQSRLLDELTREARLSGALLREIRREFDGKDWLDPALIGRLYEQELAGHRGRQRASGSFYTPDYLVDFLVQHTLQPLVKGRSPREVYELRILDPSCGGGAFLLGALRFLEAHCVRAGARPGPALRRRLIARCLVGVDLDEGAIEVCRAALLLASASQGTRGPQPVPLQLFVGDALLPQTDVGKVDAIVGNPPWGQKGLRLSPALRARYKGLFSTAVGVWDPFKFFVERCHQLLRAGGRWGLVLPDIVLLKDLQEVRDLILEGSAIEHIAHCGRAFAGANIDAVALCARRVARPAPARHRLRVWPALPEDWRQAAPPSHLQEQAVFGELSGHKFNLYLHGERLALYRRLRDLPRLGAHFEMHEGVHTGNCRAKLFVSSKKNTQCRKLVLGRKELCPYQLEWGGGWLDTSKTAIDRRAGDYANLGRPAWHARNKLVVRRTGDRVMAAFDAEGFYVSNNMFVLVPSPGSSKRFRLAVVALLNSRFMTWYFRAVQPRTGRLFAELKLIHLRDFPMPSPARWQEVEEALAVLATKGRQQGAEAVAQEVDRLVESAYEISLEEGKLIRLSE